MIKANELRIGNYVSTEVDEFISIDGTNKYRIIIEGDYVSEGYVNPIPLTEEWLLKFGFTKHGFDDPLDLYWCHPNLIGAINERCLIYDYSRLKIQYVHQLQNLYFALTGEELVCK